MVCVCDDNDMCVSVYMRRDSIGTGVILGYYCVAVVVGFGGVFWPGNFGVLVPFFIVEISAFFVELNW